MPKGVSFPTKIEASEYAKAMKGRGWETLLHHDTNTDTWIVYVSMIKEGKRMHEQKVPGSIAEIIQTEEAESAEAFWPRQAQQLGRGAKGTARDIGRKTDEALLATARGESLTSPLEHMSRRIDVIGGMKRAIPTVGGRRHGYFARIGETGAARIAQDPGKGNLRITEVPVPRIGQISQPSISSGEVGVTLGVPRSMKFQAGAPSGMRFQTPRMKRLMVGHKLLPHEEEEHV